MCAPIYIYFQFVVFTDICALTRMDVDRIDVGFISFFFQNFFLLSFIHPSELSGGNVFCLLTTNFLC